MFEELGIENGSRSHKQLTFEFYKILLKHNTTAGSSIRDSDKMDRAYAAASYFLDKYKEIEEGKRYETFTNIMQETTNKNS